MARNRKLIEVVLPLGRVLDLKERTGLTAEGIRRIGGIITNPKGRNRNEIKEWILKKLICY
jgi:hypothetical protein